MSLWDDDFDWITVSTRRPDTDRVIYEGAPWEDFLERKGDPETLAQHRKDAEELSNTPRAIKLGEMDFSTSRVLSRWPLIVWDVNGYYRDLGIPTWATKKEIKEAYQALSGDQSVRLTYVTKQLLNDAIRRAYDACRPSSRFFDKYEADFVRQQSIADHIKEYGRSLDIQEQAAQGIDPLNLDQFMNQEFDLDKAESAHYDEGRFRWGFYLWKSGEYDFEKLMSWQRYLCAASEKPERLSLGLMGGTKEEEAKIVRVGFYRVAFLHTDTVPTIELAQSLLRSYDD